MQESAACFEQPTGKALPSLLPINAPTMHSHLHAALSTNPHDFFLNKSISPQIRNITARLKDQPSLVVQERIDKLEYLEDLSQRLAGETQKWRDALPFNFPSSNINFPILHLILSSLNYTDKALAKDVSRGLPIVGPVAPTEVFKQKHTPQSLTIDVWLDQTDARNRRIIKQLCKPKDFKLATQCWAKSMDELSKNWITTPAEITDDVLREIPLTPRFAIREQHGLGPEKIRLIDDCKISDLNKTLELFETSVPDSLNVALSMARTHSLTWRQLTLQLVIVDFSHAYKHIGIDQGRQFYAHIALLSPTGIPMHCKLNTQPFWELKSPRKLG